MNWKFPLQRLTLVPLVRAAYDALKDLRVLGALLRKLARAIVPQRTRLGAQVAAGPGKGLWLELDPRFDSEYAAGHYLLVPEGDTEGLAAALCHDTLVACL